MMVPYACRRPLSLLLSVCAVILALACTASGAASSDPEARKRHEDRLGREAEGLMEDELTLSTDQAALDRVTAIGRKIAEVANSYQAAAGYGDSQVIKFDYRFKVVDDKDINAFSLPGGAIYVNTGLLDFLKSDQELAAVLAHEAAHAAHHHAALMMRQESSMDGQLAMILLAGVLAKVDSAELGNIMVGAQLVCAARSSGYGQKAETDADLTAIAYMERAGYNPVAMLTFLERLTRLSLSDENLGILQTHPPTRTRCRYVADSLRAEGIAINRQVVTGSLTSVAEPVQTGERTIWRVRIGADVLFEPAESSGVSSEERARMVATQLNQAMSTEPTVRDVTVGGDGSVVRVKGQTVMMVTSQDSASAGKPAAALASETAGRLRALIWRESLDRIY